MDFEDIRGFLAQMDAIYKRVGFNETALFGLICKKVVKHLKSA